MSQTAVVISCGNINANQYLQFWNVEYSYQLDAGGIGTASVAVGTGLGAMVPLWTSPTSTITVNAPGSSVPVLIPCPPIVRAAMFGLSVA
jgi:hypothetical protein